MILPQQILQYATGILTPEYVQEKYGAFSSTSFSVTLDASPTEGNFLVLLTGGSALRTPTMTGFTAIDMTSGGESNWCGYKFAGAGESATITVTWNLNQQGSLFVAEFRNIDSSPLIAGTGAAGLEFNADTSAPYTPFSVPNPSVYLLSMALSDQTVWSIDSGYAFVTALSRYYPTYKIYNNPDPSEAPTWTGGPDTGNYSYIGFNGKRI